MQSSIKGHTQHLSTKWNKGCVFRSYSSLIMVRLLLIQCNIPLVSSAGCDMCADNRNGECPMHGPLHSLRRLVGTSSSTPAPVTMPDVPDWLRDLPREVTLPVCLTNAFYIVSRFQKTLFCTDTDCEPACMRCLLWKKEEQFNIFAQRDSDDPRDS